MCSDEELAAFSEHVLYEMTMLVAIPKQIETEENDAKRNALLESFAIHARQLVDFFFDHADRGEITSSDYFDDPMAK